MLQYTVLALGEAKLHVLHTEKKTKVVLFSETWALLLLASRGDHSKGN